MTGSETSPRALLVVLTGSIMTALVPHWIVALRESLFCTLRVLVTASAAELVSVKALSALSGQPVLGPEWTPSQHAGADHVTIANWADAVLVAPATANFCAKLATGIADDLASSTVHSATAPVVLVPSIPTGAMGKPVTERVLGTLAADGFDIVECQKVYSVTTGRMEHGGPGSYEDVREALTRAGMRDRPAATVRSTGQETR